MRELIFVDTETTGLDPEECDLVELTWARETGDPKTLYCGLEIVPQFIDDLIGFTARKLRGKVSKDSEWTEFLDASADNTMVAANPGFDQGFLQRFGLWKFHYRMLDLESYAMAKLHLNEMPGMKTIYDMLNERGYEFTEPDHTSYNDVMALREAYHILKGM